MTSPQESPRPGYRGSWDRLVGPGATTIENGLVLGFGFSFMGAVLLYAWTVDLNWGLLQLTVVALFCLDIAGGVIANTTDAGSRWWHRPEQSRWDHFRFVAFHVHPFVVAGLFPGLTWEEATVAYGFLLLSAGLVLGVADKIRRPVAMGLVTVGVVLALYVVTPPGGLEWFLPLLYFKLIPGHLVPCR